VNQALALSLELREELVVEAIAKWFLWKTSIFILLEISMQSQQLIIQ
jgi:hypothetical protein